MIGYNVVNIIIVLTPDRNGDISPDMEDIAT